MSELVSLFNSTAQTWWSYMFHAGWQSTFVAILILTFLSFGRRWPSPLRYGLLVVALVKFAMPPLLPVPVGVFSLARPVVLPPQVSRMEAIQVNEEVASSARPVENAVESSPLIPVETKVTPNLNSPQVFSTVNPPTGSPMGLLSWKVWLMLIHLVGVSFVGGWMFLRIRQLSRSIRHGRVLSEGPLYQLYGNLCSTLGIRRIPALVALEGDCTPAAFGVISPIVMIPAKMFETSSPGAIRTIIAHELAHFRRWDLWINWVQLVLFVLWWFNPVYWLLSRKVRQVREDCCDDLLLAHGIVSGDGYCETLLEVAGKLSARTPIGAALGFSEKLHPLGRRLKRLMDPGLRRVPRLSVYAIVILFCCSVILLPGLRTVAHQGNADNKQISDSELVILYPSEGMLREGRGGRVKLWER